MSFRTWHNYGYGINVGDIPEPSVDRLALLLDYAPLLRQHIEKWFAENCISEPTYEDYMMFDDMSLYGLASMLAEVISEAEGIDFLACSNFEGDTYLIYQPSYPWALSATEATLTQDKIDAILLKYVSIIADDPIEIDHQEVENGG